MFCPNCGTENEQVATTCKKCGFNLKGAAAPKFKGTMLMVNAPPTAPRASVPTPGAPPAAGPAPLPAPVPTGAPPPAAPVRQQLKGTMLGVAPPGFGAPQPIQAPPAAQPVPAPGGFGPPPGGFGPPPGAAAPPRTPGSVNPLGGTMVADHGARPGNPYGGPVPAPAPLPGYGAAPAAGAGTAPPPPAHGGFGPPPTQAGGFGPPGGPPPAAFSPPPAAAFGPPPGAQPQGGFGAPPPASPGGAGYGAAPGSPPAHLAPAGQPPPAFAPGQGGPQPGGWGQPSPGGFGVGTAPAGYAPPGGPIPGGAPIVPATRSFAGPHGPTGTERNPVLVLAFSALCFVYGAIQLWGMLNELKSFRQKDDINPIFFFIPILGLIEMWNLPEKVLDAKRLAGISNPTVVQPILYLFLGIYFLPLDLNEIWKAAGGPRTA